MCTKECPCWSGFEEREAKEETDEDPESVSEDGPVKREVKKADRNKYSEAMDRNRALWTGYMGASERYYNKFNRTRGVKHIDDSKNPGVKFIPMVWKD